MQFRRRGQTLLRTLGRLLSTAVLLYALEATDFHYENLIAAGEHPVLLDLEALFHPRLLEGIAPKDMDEASASVLAQSVLRVGLLPQRYWGGAQLDSVDVSVLGATAGQLSWRGIGRWEGPGTDEMRFTRKRVLMSAPATRPTLNNAETAALDYVEPFVAGFTGIYRLLVQHRDELLASGGPLERFAEDEVRVIVRPTESYTILLCESTHPDVLRDALERDRLYDRLWIKVEELPFLADVVQAEREDSWNGDIPIFTARPSSCDLWTSSGERIVRFLPEPGMAMVHRRLNNLSGKDLDRQVQFIRASIASVHAGSGQPPRASSRPRELNTGASRASLLAAATATADRLERLALLHEGKASWIGLTWDENGHWGLLPLGTDLYSGLPGIALFLGYLGAVTQEGRYTRLARAALDNLRNRTRHPLRRPHWWIWGMGRNCLCLFAPWNSLGAT